MIATVITPRPLETRLHRVFKAERLPQTEWFTLCPLQLEHVLAIFKTEASKLASSNADVYLLLDLLTYEVERMSWNQQSNHRREIDRLRRQIDPVYKSQKEDEARLQAKAIKEANLR